MNNKQVEKNIETQIISIHTEYIQIDQLLKLADIISTGGQIKFFIEDSLITVNNVLCKEKRKKIYPGDIVKVKDIGQFSVKIVK